MDAWFQETVVRFAGKRVAWWLLLQLGLCIGASADARGTTHLDSATVNPRDFALPYITRVPLDLALIALPPAEQHAFWDRENLYLFGGVAVMRTLDYTSTLNMVRRGREEILLPGDVVRNHAGFAALEAASTATSIGLSYMSHRTGHHKLERWLSIGHISVAGFGAARNYALQTHHARP